MKTAISVPDKVFHEAEATAKRLGMSRSELYSRAVADFIETHRSRQVTEALDRVYGTPAASKLDRGLAEMQRRSIDDEGDA